MCVCVLLLVPVLLLNCRCLFWKDYEVWSGTLYVLYFFLLSSLPLPTFVAIAQPCTITLCVSRRKVTRLMNVMRESEMEQRIIWQSQWNEMWKWNKFCEMGWIFFSTTFHFHSISLRDSLIHILLFFFLSLSLFFSLSVLCDRLHTDTKKTLSISCCCLLNAFCYK